MRIDQDYPVQSADETDPYNDPDWIRWTAALEAQEDCQRGFGLSAGERKLTERGATQFEVVAYRAAYTAESLRRVLKDSGIDMENPYTSDQEIV
jgi:hypothetical protein